MYHATIDTSNTKKKLEDYTLTKFSAQCKLLNSIDADEEYMVFTYLMAVGDNSDNF